MDRALSFPFRAVAQKTETTTGPPPKPQRAPVFIHDAVTPWRDETMLLKLMRDQTADQDE